MKVDDFFKMNVDMMVSENSTNNSKVLLEVGGMSGAMGAQIATNVGSTAVAMSRAMKDLAFQYEILLGDQQILPDGWNIDDHQRNINNIRSDNGMDFLTKQITTVTDDYAAERRAANRQRIIDVFLSPKEVTELENEVPKINSLSALASRAMSGLVGIYQLAAPSMKVVGIAGGIALAVGVLILVAPMLKRAANADVRRYVAALKKAEKSLRKVKTLKDIDVAERDILDAIGELNKLKAAVRKDRNLTKFADKQNIVLSGMLTQINALGQTLTESAYDDFESNEVTEVTALVESLLSGDVELIKESCGAVIDVIDQWIGQSDAEDSTYVESLYEMRDAVMDVETIPSLYVP